MPRRDPNEPNPAALNFAIGIFIACAAFGVFAEVRNLPQFRVTAPVCAIGGTVGAIASITLRSRFTRR
jgi:hypothetical protein